MLSLVGVIAIIIGVEVLGNSSRFIERFNRRAQTGENPLLLPQMRMPRWLVMAVSWGFVLVGAIVLAIGIFQIVRP